MTCLSRLVCPALLAIALGAAAAPALAAPTPPAECSAPNGWQAVEAAARQSMAATPGLAIAVVCRGTVVFEGAYGTADAATGEPLTPDSVFRLASITKTVTGAMLLKLADEGRLTLDDPLAAYLPDFPGAHEVTLRHLVTHTSGLADFPNDAGYPARKARDHTSAEMIAWIAALEPRTLFAPGEGWAYSNSGYVLLGAVIEKATGQSLEAAYQNRLFGPLGLHSMAFDFPDAGPASSPVRGHRRSKDGSYLPAEAISMTLPGPAGSLRATAADAALFGDALFGGRVLTPAGLAEMTRPGTLRDGRSNRWGMPDEWREGLKADYGAGVFVDDHTGRRRYWHSGDLEGFQTWLAHYPDDGVTIVLLRNSENGDPGREAIQTAVFEALGN